VRMFIPQIWVEALNRSIIRSLDENTITALCVQYEKDATVSRLKRRNTQARRRRRAVIKREKRTLRDANTKGGE
jgi:hypothetical protein